MLFSPQELQDFHRRHLETSSPPSYPHSQDTGTMVQLKSRIEALEHHIYQLSSYIYSSNTNGTVVQPPTTPEPYHDSYTENVTDKSCGELVIDDSLPQEELDNGGEFRLDLTPEAIAMFQASAERKKAVAESLRKEQQRERQRARKKRKTKAPQNAKNAIEEKEKTYKSLFGDVFFRQVMDAENALDDLFRRKAGQNFVPEWPAA